MYIKSVFVTVSINNLKKGPGSIATALPTTLDRIEASQSILIIKFIYQKVSN